MSKKQLKKNDDRPNPRTDTEYVNITLNVRKEDQSTMLNSYLGLVVSNFEKGAVQHAPALSQAILANSGHTALAHLSHYKEHVLEVLDGLSILERDIEEILIGESTTIAAVTFKEGQGYTTDEFNQAISKSSKELNEERAAIKKKRAARKK